MSDALDDTSAVYCPVVPSDWIAVAMSPLDAFGVPAVPVKTKTFAGAASAGAVPTTKNAASNASTFHADRQIGASAALRTSIRSLLRPSLHRFRRREATRGSTVASTNSPLGGFLDGT